MRRLIFLAAAVLCVSVSANAQERQERQTWLSRAKKGKQADQAAQSAERRNVGPLARAGARPAELLPLPDHVMGLLLQGAAASDASGESIVLSEQEVLHRISRVYGYQSEILMAEAAGDQRQVRALLDLAMTEVSTLARQPGASAQERFHDLLLSVIAQYEKLNGPLDSTDVQFGDVFTFRAEMFGELNDVEEPLTEEEILAPAVTVSETVFPMTMNRLVESSMQYLLRSPKKHLFNWMSRAETYFPMIERILREEGVPDELKYLAMIESGLVPTAQSWASAGGLWQFIVPTGKAYGLRVNEYVDERRDPEKATRAAARHLLDLHKMFGGDWQLALAGYNCSPARIKRAIARAENRTGRRATFWDIYNDIPKETRGYVPMFIATALIASNPDAYNLPPVTPGPRYEYEWATVPGGMSLSEIASLAGTDESRIKTLNPQLRKSATPRNEDTYELRMPVGTSGAFAANDGGAPARREAGAQVHVVQRGESLKKIAGRYGVSVEDIREANGLVGSAVRPGRSLTIPSSGSEVRSAGNLAVNEAKVVRYGERVVFPIVADSGERTSLRYQGDGSKVVNVQPQIAEARSERSSGTPVRNASDSDESRETRVVYKVRRGDSLGKIASRYGVSVADIKRWNRVRGTTIHAGQRLTLYPNGGSNVSQASYSESSSARSSSSSSRIVYKVRRGDTLSRIAERHGVSISQLRQWNDIKGSKLLVGQRLSIHGKGGSVSSGKSSSAKTKTYTVRRGDTLGKIAARNGTTVSKLKSTNRLRGNTIRVGQRLKIPQ